MSSPNLIPAFSADGNSVFVTDSTGTPGSIPVEQLADAVKSQQYSIGVSPEHYQKVLQQGGKAGVHVTDPNGQDGLLPNDQVAEALKNGYKLGPSNQQPDPTVGTPYEGVARIGKGAIAKAKGLLALPGQVYHAVTDPAETPDEVAAVQHGGGLSLGINRLIGNPMLAEQKKADQTTGIESLGHRAAGSIPGIGPFAGQTGEEIGKDPLEGAGGLAVNLLAPKAIESGLKYVVPRVPGMSRAVVNTASNAVDSFNDARSKVAQSIVKPLIRKPLGKTLTDMQFERQPASGIADEGIVAGTTKGLAEKTEARIAQVSKATDSVLQNHPNANAVIDTAPIIDSGIDEAVTAARKTGNQAMITRLENLREALHTEYGPTKGTPFEMNNLKKEIGKVASDLGAFKSTDPVEASAAAAMQSIYSGIKDAVNNEVPEAAPLNDRASNLISARTGILRRLAQHENKGFFDGMDVWNSPFKMAGKVVNSTPFRTGAARAVNFGNKLDTPEILPPPAKVAPMIRGALNKAPIITPQPGASPVTAVPPPIAATTRAQRMGLLLPQGTTPPARPVPLGESPLTATADNGGVFRAARRVDPETGRVQFLTSAAEPEAPTPPQGKLQLRAGDNPSVVPMRRPQVEMDAPPAQPKTPEQTAAPTIRQVQEGGDDRPLVAKLDPTSHTAARISELRNELVRTADPAEREKIQQGIDYEITRASGSPWMQPDQATAENLPAPTPKPPRPPEIKTTAVSRVNPGELAMVDTKELRTDPSRFQYKSGVDESGVTNALKDSKKYDPNKAGVLLTWEDPADKKTYVVNGHHRFELARRTGEPAVPIMKIKAGSAEEARAIGAEVNISEGHGTGVDAARFFKQANIKSVADAQARDLPLGQAKVQDGIALARLDDSILNKIESGDISESRGVAIGAATDDPAQQEAILKLIDKQEAKGRRVNNDTVAELSRFVKNSGNKTVEQGGLFGANQEIHSLALDKADISSYIKQQIAKERRTFGAVATKGKAAQLAKVEGQSIKVDENAKIAEQATRAMEAYNKLSAVRGPVDDILENAAKDLAAGYNKPEQVKAKAYEGIRQHLISQIGSQ
jgi:hypothetical protein